MSADKRQVATDALETLGMIIGPNEKRDAIHLAVEPIEAGEALRPGDHVYIDGGKAYSLGEGRLVGIVDPFLKETLQPGQRFWLVVYPRQITSLRHVWEHPDFPASGETEHLTGPLMSESEIWIQNFADRVGLSYEALMDGADNWVSSKRRGGWGEYLNYGPLLESKYVPDEFWDHYEKVKKEQVDREHRGSFFTCSC